jgi:hypothetical protein
MKIKAMLGGMALAVPVVIGASASPAAAACGRTIEVHNRLAAGVTIDWDDSDARTSTVVAFGVRVAGPWARLDTGDTFVAASDTESRAVVLNLVCNMDRQYRIEVNQGGSSWFEYFPSQTTWNRDTTPHIHVD